MSINNQRLKISFTNTTIRIHGIPTLKQLNEILVKLQEQYPGIYDNYIICTNFVDPIDRGMLDMMSDAEKGVIDFTKNYFPGCSPQEVEHRMQENWQNKYG